TYPITGEGTKQTGCSCWTRGKVDTSLKRQRREAGGPSLALQACVNVSPRRVSPGTGSLLTASLDRHGCFRPFRRGPISGFVVVAIHTLQLDFQVQKAEQILQTDDAKQVISFRHQEPARARALHFPQSGKGIRIRRDTDGLDIMPHRLA